MEVFLWFWLLDKRWLCGYRPIMRNYIILWFFPVTMNAILLTLNIYYISHSLYLNIESNIVYQYFIMIKSLISLISIICSILLVRDLVINHQRENFSLIEILSEKINKSEEKFNKNNDFNMIFSDDEYWCSRKCLLNSNGKFVLLIGICQIFCSIYYLRVRNSYIYYIDYTLKQFSSIELLFALPVFFIFGISFLIKLITFISSYACPNVIIILSKLFSNHKHQKKIDFSDIKNYEIEDI